MRMKERRTMRHLVFGICAGVLAVLLACAGTAAGEMWVVVDDGGAGVNYTSIQAAVGAASAGDTTEVRDVGGECSIY